MDEKRVKEVFSDEAFVSGLMGMETPEEVQAALKDKGVDISLEEIGKLRDKIINANGSKGELSTEDLDDVAGGSVITSAIITSAIGALNPGAVLPITPSLIPSSTNSRW